VQSEAELKAEEERSAKLASTASSLKELIEKLQKQDNQQKGFSQDFGMLKGTLALPVAGKQRLHFGDADGYGGIMSGMTLTAPPLSLVLTPVNAKVLYAGPFRSYRQLLILDAGHDYHLIIGGMNKKMVATGQTILSGEPVGAMGEQEPELYIELRHNKKPIDPNPWWAIDPKGSADAT
jgi:murein hydrolase activator